MSRTKTRQRPAPPHRTKASRKEVRVLIPGHALGDRAFLLMRRRAGRWSVTDSFRGVPAYVGAGEVWRELEPDTAEAELYCWTEARARALVARFVAQAVEIARNNRALDAAFEAAETARRIEQLAAGMAPAAVMPERLTLEQVAARLQQATAEVAARMTKAHAPKPETGTSIPAPMDQPGWRPPKPDPAPELAPDVKLLGLKARRISVNAEDETVALPQLRVHGPAETAQFPPLPPDAPPLPTMPPTIHLKHLTESAPSAGEGARASVAEALAPDLVH